MEGQYDVTPFVGNIPFSCPLPPLEQGSCSREGGLAKHLRSCPALSCSQTATLLEGSLKLGFWEQKFKYSQARYSIGSIQTQSLTTGSSSYTHTSFLH